MLRGALRQAGVAWRRADTFRRMRALVQRVSRAAVKVDGRVTGAIGPGLLVLLGVAREDDSLAADRLAEKVRATGRRVEMDPMSPRDRRTIHLALQDEPGVTTRSDGEGRDRHLVIEPTGAPRR